MPRMYLEILRMSVEIVEVLIESPGVSEVILEMSV
jgi:hypothetical protein